MIRVILGAACAIYLVIIGLQVAARPSLWVEGLLAGTALAAATAMYFVRDRVILGAWEKAALWAAVLLFLGYTLARLGGIA
ncbi:MAG: hypothetical protein QFX32_05805 [Methanolinea sp.]|nr:hypothetical protein [Methanolinea sp.]